MYVIDADAHVEEPAAAFADPYWDPALADRRPRVVPVGDGARWEIEGRLYPKLVGPGAHFFASPASYEGRPTPFSAVKRDPVPSIELTDLDARLRTMEEEHIDLQVIYPSLFLHQPLADDPALNNALFRSWNSWIADVCAQRPDKFKWVCVANLCDVPAAVAELRRARDLGAVGVMILGTAGERKLDHAEIDPFWAAAEALNLPVAVHVGWSSRQMNAIFDNVFDAATLSFNFCMITGFVDVTAGGVLDRHPGLKVAFFEAGCEWIPFILDKMQHRYDLSPSRYGYVGQLSPYEYARSEQVYFGFEVDDQLLPFVLELVGDERFMYASDIPHSDREFDAAGDLMRRDDVSDSAKRKLLADNAVRFYGL